ncbi:ABC transporter permease [Denitratisoma sp. DHT3]|uniref:ABC transporter permease n=1 Tax=Denitratisoma sp. DHT3 TaxID=1981880 RepID=UPI0011984BFB|nr:ABC transporter permease [Denitratisoma sp. DHT3]QDX82042.1 ABC transporter permease [Denitratisoma sp. DHT3]
MNAFSAWPHQAFLSLWRHRHLTRQMLRREVEGRYRGTLMGLTWSFITPLFMLGVYTFAFSLVFRARWPQGGLGDSHFGFVLILFAGLIVFGLFQECASRAHTLVADQPNYVKKVVFPLEILPWAHLGAALVHLAIALGLLLAVQLLATGQLQWTVLLLPLVLLPLGLGLLGLMWLMAALGVYFRDLGQIVSVLISAMMFLSPIFYPVSAVPPGVRWLIFLNPLSYFIETARGVILWGTVPDLVPWLTALAIALALLAFGFAAFQKLRKGFADVL